MGIQEIGIPPDLLRRLQDTMRRCGPFDQHETLKALFVDGRINDWKDQIPLEAKNVYERVTIFIAWLLHRYNTKQENALVLFLHVLSAQCAKTDACHKDISELADQLERFLQNNIRFSANSIFFLIYDWEDRPGAKQLVDSLRRRGLRLSWDQDWAYWKDRTQELKQKIQQADTVLFYSTLASQHSEWAAEEISIAKDAGKRVIDLEGHIPSEAIADALIQKLHIEGLTPQRIQAAQGNPTQVVREKLQAALEKNLGLPSDTITDKIFASPEVCKLIEEAYAIAKDNILPGWAPERLKATLEYGRLQRFRGEWDEAEKVLKRGEIFARRGKSDLHSLFCLELGALRFEQGDDAGIYLVEEALDAMRDKDLMPELTKALRQLGNMHREQSSWDKAADYLSRAMHIAQYIKDVGRQAVYTSMPYEARYLLWIDCVREYASLLSQQGRVEDAINQFKGALTHTQSAELAGYAEHLRGIILYQLGRAYLMHQKDIKLALGYFDDSIQILRKYDNPVRLAFICDAMGKAITHQRFSPDLEKAQHYLEKAKRVRDRCGHLYFSTYTMLGLADLYQLQGNFTLAINELLTARTTLFNLGKRRDAGIACFEIGECYYKYNKKADAAEYFKKAKDIFKELDLNDRLRETEYMILKIKFGDSLETISPDQLLEWGVSEDYVFHLREIGEYHFHMWLKRKFNEWMKKEIPRIPGIDAHIRDLIQVGIGDDATVITMPNSDTYDLVVNTDAAPGSICRSTDIEMGKYAAKFSVVHSLSDILAMGGTPIAILLNMYLNRDVTLEYAMTIPMKVQEEAEKYNIALVGGDMKERTEQSIGCIAIGIVEKGKAIQRNAAKPGQIVAITQAGMPDGSGPRRIGRRWAQEVIEYMGLTEEEPYRSFCHERNWKKELLFLPWKEMIAGAKEHRIRSAIDTSDGFLSCLQLIGRTSGVSFVLEERLIEDIIDGKVKAIARAMGYRPAQFLFNAGHDWEIVLTVDETDFDPLQSAMRKTGGDLARLGAVIPQTEKLGDGIALVSSGNGDTYKIPFFTDEKFVKHPYQQRTLDWEDLKFYMEGRHKLDL